MPYAPMFEQPAFWGAAGAFIYAAPQWLACLVACGKSGSPAWSCTAEFGVALATGAIAAGAFTALAVGMNPIKDVNAIASMIGLLANSTAPLLVKRASKLAADRLAPKIIPGEDL
jgi:hypothetical protein